MQATKAQPTSLRSIAFAAALLAAPFSASACNSEPYVGSVCTVVMNWCPQGYAQANGAILPISSNQVLFSLIGNAFGGDGVSTFALPDLRGRAVVGTGQGTGLPAVALAQKIGQAQVTLNANQLPAHTHPATFTGTGGGQVTIPATPGNLTVTAALPLNTTPTGSGTAASGANYLSSVTASIGASTAKFNGPFGSSAPAAATATLPATVTTSGSAGTPQIQFNSGFTAGQVAVGANQTTGAATSTQSPALGMTVCIATTGLYPSRP